MAHTIRLTEDVPFVDDVCRLLEIRADTPEELCQLEQRAIVKGWTPWIRSSQALADGRWGLVLEKGMPEAPDIEGLLLMAELESFGISADERVDPLEDWA